MYELVITSTLLLHYCREVLADEQVLSQTKDDLRNKLEADPQLPDCVQHREQLHIVILNTKCDIQMWAQRLARLQELNLNLKPVYEHEQLQGRFNPQAFPLEASMSLHTSVSAGRMSSKMSSGMSLGSGGSRSPSPTNRTPVARTTPTLTPSRSKASARNTGGFPSPTSSAYVPGHPHGQGQSQSQVVVPLALRPADLEELFERDPTLAVALSSLRGKESTILATLPDEAQNKAKAAAAAGGGGGGGKGGGVPPKADAFQKNSVAERDQNMTAWVTLKVLGSTNVLEKI